MIREGNMTDFVPTHNLSSSQPEKPLGKTPLWFATVVMLVFMIIAIVPGNVLVLVTTWLEKRLHQPNKYFIACLAFADLLVGVFSVPIRLHMYLNHETHVKLQLCRFFLWIDICGEVASIVSLTVISIDRYFKISRPFEYRSTMTTSKALIIICIIWFVAFIHATLGMFSYDNSKGVTAGTDGCDNDNVVYYTITACVFFFFPLAVILIMYGLIFRVSYAQEKMNRKGRLGRTFSSRRKRPVNKEMHVELKTIRMLLVVVGAFAVCWAPFFVMYLISQYKPEHFPSSQHTRNILGSIFFVILPSFNSLCNPIIYACFDQAYSKAFQRLFQRIPGKKSISLRRRLSRSSNTQSVRLNSHLNRDSAENSCPAENSLL